MAVAFTNRLANGSTTDTTTSYTTGSFSVTSGLLYMFSVGMQSASSITSNPVMTTNGSETLTLQKDSGNGVRRVCLYGFRASATTSSRTVTIDVSGIGVTIARGLWIADEVTGESEGDTYPGAFAPSNAVAAQTSITLDFSFGPLAAPYDSDDRVYGVCMPAQDPTVGTGTQIAETAAFESQRLNSAYGTTSTLQWTFASANAAAVGRDIRSANRARHYRSKPVMQAVHRAARW